MTANGLWFPNVDKKTSSQFTVSATHHLFSFATMLGPSPDWLSGIKIFQPQSIILGFLIIFLRIKQA